MKENKLIHKKNDDVIGFGDLVIDIMTQVKDFPIAPPQTQALKDLDVQPGGMANFLIAGKRLGLNTIPMDILGEDLFGKWLVNMLDSEGIDISVIKILPEVRSKVVLVLTDESGGHAFLGHLGSNQPELCLDPSWKKVLDGAAAILVVGYSLLEEYIGDTAVEAMSYMKNKAGSVFFDPGPMARDIPSKRIIQAIKNSDVLLMTDDECGMVVDRCECRDLKGLLSLGPSMICIKLGPGGCKIINRDQEILCPGFKVNVKDTSGAGDSFAAAFIYGVLNGYSLAETGKLANAMGAAKVQKFGTGRNVPTREEILKVLEINRV